MAEFFEYIKEFDGEKYLVSPAFVDIPTDEQVGPVGEAHRQYLNYNIVTHFDGGHIINYSWIDTNDHIYDFVNEGVNKIIMNSQNLRRAIFIGSKKVTMEINVTCGVLELVRSLLGFFKNNSNVIDTIVFKGVIESYASNEILHLCSTFGVTGKIVKEDVVERNSYIKKFDNYK